MYVKRGIRFQMAIICFILISFGKKVGGKDMISASVLKDMLTIQKKGISTRSITNRHTPFSTTSAILIFSCLTPYEFSSIFRSVYFLVRTVIRAMTKNSSTLSADA